MDTDKVTRLGRYPTLRDGHAARVQVVFASAKSFLSTTPKLQESLRGKLKIPSFFDRMHLQSSGFCGYDVWLDKNEDLEFYTMYTYWSRFTVKQTYDKLQPKRTFTPHISNHHNGSGEWNADITIHGPQSARHGWEWYEMGFFACWTQSGSLTLLCFDLPAKSQSDIHSTFCSQNVSHSCPYAVFPQVLDALLRLYDDSVWAIRNHISQWEAAHQQQRRSLETDYFLLHEIARHGVHVSETLSVAIRSLDAMQHHHERFRADSNLARSKNGRRRWDKVGSRFEFQLGLLQGLLQRSEANNARIQNEITLAFNAAAQRDSKVQLQIGEEAKREASAMKAIAVVTMTFFPATFVSFTIGWICPLPLEKEAARLVLDEEYPQEEVQYQNAYYLGGRIGKHKVVMGVQRGIGLEYATSLAERMRAGFPNIRHFLLVGIAGGVPRYGPAGAVSEIVLGDVVVSSPRGNHGGVLQYDRGAWKGQGRLNFRGHTNGVPGDLLAAVNNFRADGWSKTNIAEVLKQMRLKLDEQRKHQYDDPGVDADRLFQDTYEHQGTELDDCSACCDARYIISRSARGEGAKRSVDNPSVHFGNIASSNQLQISAVERNRVRREHDAICFEMEAAGVMNEYSCVVVRGICDYADSHKNKGWQNYAAATAAAARSTEQPPPQQTASTQNNTFGNSRDSIQAGIINGNIHDAMASATSTATFGNANRSIQAHTINGSVEFHVPSGYESTLGRLPQAADAPFNSYVKQDEPACLPGTRVDLLHEIYSWVDGTDERSAAAYQRRCSKARSDIVSQALGDQWQHLVCSPLSELRESEQGPETYVVVVDALDECDSDSNIRIIVQLLAKVPSSINRRPAAGVADEQARSADLARGSARYQGSTRTSRFIEYRH
ncbi:purine and uridine phosphorylase [Lizonia empirigonia]|nr:purine and uridine phosphorylase [Lizonia empirigonia]